jgi:hypothetical protein
LKYADAFAGPFSALEVPMGLEVASEIAKRRPNGKTTDLKLAYASLRIFPESLNHYSKEWKDKRLLVQRVMIEMVLEMMRKDVRMKEQAETIRKIWKKYVRQDLVLMSSTFIVMLTRVASTLLNLVEGFASQRLGKGQMDHQNPMYYIE